MVDVVESEKLTRAQLILRRISTEKSKLGSAVKNRTHNHPTEIRPFGGAATCIGGANRDPTFGQKLRIRSDTCDERGESLTPESETRPESSRKEDYDGTASGYSSYGNQIGLTTGLVDEVSQYVARMEVGAVVAKLQQKVSGERGQKQAMLSSCWAAELVETESAELQARQVSQHGITRVVQRRGGSERATLLRRERFKTVQKPRGDYAH